MLEDLVEPLTQLLGRRGRFRLNVQDKVEQLPGFNPIDRRVPQLGAGLRVHVGQQARGHPADPMDDRLRLVGTAPRLGLQVEALDVPLVVLVHDRAELARLSMMAIDVRRRRLPLRVSLFAALVGRILAEPDLGDPLPRVGASGTRSGLCCLKALAARAAQPDTPRRTPPSTPRPSARIFVGLVYLRTKLAAVPRTRSISPATTGSLWSPSDAERMAAALSGRELEEPADFNFRHRGLKRNARQWPGAWQKEFCYFSGLASKLALHLPPDAPPFPGSAHVAGVP